MARAAHLAGGRADVDEAVVRWQYLFEDSYLFDSTITGWHSYGEAEAASLERLYESMNKQGSEPCSVRLHTSGYEYEVDVRGMVQRNLKTCKSRTIRRVELSYQREAMAGGDSFGFETGLVEGEEVSWAWEVHGERDRIDFSADFLPGPAAVSGEPVPRSHGATNVMRATRGAHAWSYTACQAGLLKLSWSNVGTLFTPKPCVLLVDCRRGAAASAGAGESPEEEPEALSELEGDSDLELPDGEGDDEGEEETPEAILDTLRLAQLDAPEDPPAEAVGDNNAPAPEPPYWSGRARGCDEGWLLERVVDEATLAALRQVLAVSKPTELGRGHDVKRYPRAYRQLDVFAAWRIECPAAFRIFAERRSQVARQVAALRRERLPEAPLDVATGVSGGGLPGPVDPEANEVWLLHGCAPPSVLDICQDGLSERLSSMGGAYGAGIYLAENVEKIDQYTVPDHRYMDAGVEALHSRLFGVEGGLRHPRHGEADPRPGSADDLFYCFVVRAVCGWPVRTLGCWRRNRSPPAMDHADVKVHQDETRRELMIIPGTGTRTVPQRYRFNCLIASLGKLLRRWREFVIFDRTQTYPEYVVAYTRRA